MDAFPALKREKVTLVSITSPFLRFKEDLNKKKLKKINVVLIKIFKISIPLELKF